MNRKEIKCFKKFLKYAGIKKQFKELIKERDCKVSLYLYLVVKEDVFTGAAYWKDSVKGYKYWSEINKLWRKIC